MTTCFSHSNTHSFFSINVIPLITKSLPCRLTTCSSCSILPHSPTSFSLTDIIPLITQPPFPPVCFLPLSRTRTRALFLSQSLSLFHSNSIEFIQIQSLSVPAFLSFSITLLRHLQSRTIPALFYSLLSSPLLSYYTCLLVFRLHTISSVNKIICPAKYLILITYNR